MDRFAPSFSNTVAVMVIYHPEGDLAERLRRVIQQVALVIVVANDGGGLERFSTLPAGRARCITQASNVGLASALNQGLLAAVEAGALWCLLLDQDSQLDSDLISRLAEIHQAHAASEKIAILAPNYRSPLSGKLAYPPEPAFREVDTVITSGAVLRLSVLSSLGFMMEPFFIEGIDVEYCLRARKAGFLVVAAGRALMTHGAGSGEERRLGRRTVLISNHAPWRYYLQFRNLSWILCHYGTFNPGWTVRAVVGLGKKLTLILLFESRRSTKLAAIARGIYHGVTGRLGYNILDHGGPNP